MNTSIALSRKTKETDITLTIDRANLTRDICTGIGFFDHMLDALFCHARLGLQLKVTGDLHVDAHHTVEDTGILLGQAIGKLLGDKAGLTRYASAFVPLDEALASAVVDISGRPFLVYQVALPQGASGDYDYSLSEEFFRALATHAGLTLHISLMYGQNGHHITEAVFKAVARALRGAMAPCDGEVSTKGCLGA